MRKNRNSFFTESNMSYQGFAPNMMMQQPNLPIQAGASYNSYYTGPNINATEDDILSKIAKMERQINRLELRVSKLENTNNTTYIEDIDTSGNMYML